MTPTRPDFLLEHTFRSAKLGEVVKEAIRFLETSPVCPLPPKNTGAGGGVYCLYYLGDFAAYAPLSIVNREEVRLPIYVGKAVPPGWRTARRQATSHPTLIGRLREHARTIRSVKNLELDSFRCRFVFLLDEEADLVVPVEASLIRLHKPLWNSVIDGFGNHDPGSGRYNQAPSEWDVLHPGRPWTRHLTGSPPSLEEVLAKVERALRGRPS